MTRAVLLAGIAAFLCGCSEPADPQPPQQTYQRVVTLAPNLTELIYAVGAAETLVGVSAWSDYPPPARQLPVVGDAFNVDHERLLLLNPDLMLVWESGTPAHTIEKLRELGYTVEAIRTRSLADVSAAMRRIGRLTGHAREAERAAAIFDDGLQSLRQAQAGSDRITVFYQVSARPLYTVNGEHYVSELIEICGGHNVFEGLSELAPAISVEAVVERNPEVMLASTDAGTEGFAVWERWPEMRANRYGNQYLLPADEIARATPRLLLAGAAVCTALQQARKKRAAVETE